ncbi:putative WRKY transcription factor 14 [Apium graveolens]|uniref:putative WRKY transcription factor 14 n=1 Tax=Apium graveolens TaxID=4045 RepID=UPI003D793228
MENYHGDLADIIRAGGGSTSGNLGSSSTTTTSGGAMTDSWQFQTDPMSFDDFGHPFSSLRDPLLLSDPVDMSGGSSSFFSNSNSLEDDSTAGFCGASAGGNSFMSNLDHQHQEMKKPNNYYSRMLQISPNSSNLSRDDSPVMVANSPRLLIPSSTLISSSSNDHHMISLNSSKAATTNCLVDNTGLQISSPRNTGIKRRKSQAKKVVCIPAPTPVNSRPTGEILPSDLWAWRKYGQKPIKGSPYPRGYYRCSSSKGCSARKQVERSRTDPNMLVITYTSEHNHPWPTQRNALAGSTRTQPASKSTTTTSKTSPTAASQSQKSPELSNMKEELKENNEVENMSTSPTSTKSQAIVKVEDQINDEEDKKLLTEMEDPDQFTKGFPPFESYTPTLAGDSINHIPDQDFFAELGEIESDPLNLLFIQGFDEKLESDKTLDPFTFYDWTRNTNNK